MQQRQNIFETQTLCLSKDTRFSFSEMLLNESFSYLIHHLMTKVSDEKDHPSVKLLRSSILEVFKRDPKTFVLTRTMTPLFNIIIETTDIELINEEVEILLELFEENSEEMMFSEVASPVFDKVFEKSHTRAKRVTD